MTRLEVIDLSAYPASTDARFGKRNYRTPEEVREFFAELQKVPGRWVAYSEHKSAGGASSRRHQISRQKRYSDYKVEWRTLLRPTDGNPNNTTLMVRWTEDNSANSVPARIFPSVATQEEIDAFSAAHANETPFVIPESWKVQP